MNRLIAATLVCLPIACSSTSAPVEPTPPDAAPDASADAGASLPSDDAAPDVGHDTTAHEPDVAARDVGNDSSAHEPDAAAVDPSCIIEESSTLPHVRLVLRAATCAYTLAEAARGVAIPYDLIVEEDVPGFTTSAYAYAPDAANLLITARLAGGEQSYCYCDRGLPYATCPSDDGGVAHPDIFRGDAQAGWATKCEPFTIPAGIHHFTFTWHGRNWYGPSDTGQMEKGPFPPGDYELNISTNKGTLPDHDGAALGAVARMHIHLLP